jgi:Protein of unknown function (DUF2480)
MGEENKTTIKQENGSLDDKLINRVASSALLTFDLEEYYTPGDRILFDIKPLLFQELILKEKDFRQFLKDHNWSQYHGKFVAITCTADAIVPTWAYMLIAIALQPWAGKVVFGNKEQLETQLFLQALQKVNWPSFQEAKVVVKGCSKVAVPEAVYVEVASRLTPYVSSLMFGEPCSTVPLYKKPKNI